MKPELLKVLASPNNSFNIRYDVVPYFYNRWHFHPELELVHIEKGTGIQFTGDNIARFEDDDVLLIGAYLPHYWKCDDSYFEKNSTLKAIATVAHFRSDFWGKDFLELPENRKLKDLFQKAKKGISIKGPTKKLVIQYLKEMQNAEGTTRIILLLQALYTIATSRNIKVISETVFEQSAENKESERLNIIYKYTLDNFKSNIPLQKIAEIAHISPNSFCRYFKAHTRKNYNLFLQELRVGYASKLLIENKENITRICYQSGFNNVTNFYKSFKKITGKTPLEYQNYFIKEG
ncbi:MAG: AraC family transcriptional regulator [Bacteroidota bacterium]